MEHIVDIIIYIIKGCIIGIVASAPMGPVGILCIRRTIKKGRAYGLVTGVGAALSDLIYALLTGFGLSMIDVLTRPEYVLWVKLAGCVMLMAFGIYMYRTGPRMKLHTESKTKGTLFRNFITSFFITLFNPTIIFLFLALFNMMAPFAGSTEVDLTIAGYAAIVGGAMLWWTALTYVINKMSASFGDNTVTTFNRVVGIIVMTIAAGYMLLTILGYSFVTP